MSQRTRVLDDLRKAGTEGVCAAHWYANAIPNARNRIAELRDDGFLIESHPCQIDHAPGDPSFFRYELKREAPAKQMRMIA